MFVCVSVYLSVCVCVHVCVGAPPLQDEWLSGPLGGDDPLCTVLSNNHNFHLTGKWFDEKCTESRYGFVCQKPQGRTPLCPHAFCVTYSPSFRHIGAYFQSTELRYYQSCLYYIINETVRASCFVLSKYHPVESAR